MWKRRWELISSAAERKGYDIAVANTIQNVFYVTGFWGDGVGVIKDGNCTLISSPLDHQRAIASSRECEVHRAAEGQNVLHAALAEVGQGMVCFDSADAQTGDGLRKTLTERCVFDSTIFLEPRRRKDSVELEAITKAARVLDQLFEYSSQIIAPGVTEREVAAELAAHAIKNGCDLSNFPSTKSPLIVATGTNSAFPHSELTDRKLARGDFLVVDLFVRYDGYFADMTRTFAISSVSPEARRTYESVRKAQQAGLDYLKIGVRGSDVDKVVRDEVSKTGLGTCFVHGTGHGLGIDVHEAPSLKTRSKDILDEGDVVTIEPGLYIPGSWGVRIEDTAIISDGVSVLTRFTKDLLVLG